MVVPSPGRSAPRQAPEHIRETWSGTSWIVEVIAVGIRDGRSFRQTHCFLTSLRTTPEALLQLVQDRWSLVGWHWIRDTQLHEDAHRYRGKVPERWRCCGQPLSTCCKGAVFSQSVQGCRLSATTSRRCWSWRSGNRQPTLAETLNQPWVMVIKRNSSISFNICAPDRR